MAAKKNISSVGGENYKKILYFVKEIAAQQEVCKAEVERMVAQEMLTEDWIRLFSVTRDMKSLLESLEYYLGLQMILLDAKTTRLLQLRLQRAIPYLSELHEIGKRIDGDIVDQIRQLPHDS